jgi:hypothetical protein
MRNRGIASKEAEENLFNAVDVYDNVDPILSLNTISFDKVITNLDEAKASLNGEQEITCYFEYDDTSASYDGIGLNCSTLLSASTAPNKHTLPELYYHSTRECEVPILDTNNPASSSAFIDVFTGTLTKTKESGEEGWTYIGTLKDILANDLMPENYKFQPPADTIPMNGLLSDYSGIEPQIFSKEQTDKPQAFDLTEVYVAKDASYLYIAMRFRGNPYTGPFTAGEYLNYHLKFNAKYDDCNMSSSPISIELRGFPPSIWQWHIYSFGSYIGPADPSYLGDSDYAMTDIVELRIPLSYIKDRIDDYHSYHFPEGWDGKELYMSVSLYSYVGGIHCDDWTDGNGCLLELNYDYKNDPFEPGSVPE